MTLLRGLSPDCKITLSTHFAEQDREAFIVTPEEILKYTAQRFGVFCCKDLEGIIFSSFFRKGLRKMTWRCKTLSYTYPKRKSCGSTAAPANHCENIEHE